ncbi:MAG TPA: DUF4177 domain-containing protein [Isosphaeraceae bacterium]|jgi:hypothetical protein
MSITVRCSCGKQSDLPESFLGKRVRCNFCGALSIVDVQEAPEDHPELDWETHVAESLLSGPEPSAGEVSKTALMERPVVHEAPATDEADSVEAEESVEAGAEPEPVPAFTRVEGAKEYKVLTQRDKWFGGKFDPERFEAALNFFAGHGWVVRSMVSGNVAGFSGNREEVVVLLERG